MVTIEAADQKNDLWQVSIRDTGVGMDKITQEKLFQKNSPTITTYGTNDEKGTGLGLSLCKDMVENNNGQHLGGKYSSQEKATCFYFTLPKSRKKIPVRRA